MGEKAWAEDQKGRIAAVKERYKSKDDEMDGDDVIVAALLIRSCRFMTLSRDSSATTRSFFKCDRPNARHTHHLQPQSWPLEVPEPRQPPVLAALLLLQLIPSHRHLLEKPFLDTH